MGITSLNFKSRKLIAPVFFSLALERFHQCDSISCRIFSESNRKQRHLGLQCLNSNLFAQIFSCLFNSPKHIWKEEMHFEPMVYAKVPSDTIFWLAKNLQRSALGESRHNYAKARRLWAEDRIKSKKNIVHGIRLLMVANTDDSNRYLLHACQIITTGKLSDFTEGNAIWDEIMSCTSGSIE
jgi:hypothetical protein